MRDSNRVIQTEAGEMRVTTKNGVWGVGLVPEKKPMHIGFITMEPKSLFIPQYLDSTLILFIRRGEARIGLIYKDDFVERNVTRGDVYRIPAGSTFYIENSGEGQRLQSIGVHSRLPDGSLMEITKVYPFDAVYGSPEDVPEDVKANKHYSGSSNWTVKFQMAINEAAVSSEHLESWRCLTGKVEQYIEDKLDRDLVSVQVTDEYNQLIQKLAEVFVGKIHRLKGSIKILCSAAKKCMKDKKMHLGPWRKKEYMKAKWLAMTCERTTAPAPASVTPLYTGVTRPEGLRHPC